MLSRNILTRIYECKFLDRRVLAQCDLTHTRSQRQIIAETAEEYSCPACFATSLRPALNIFKLSQYRPARNAQHTTYSPRFACRLCLLYSSMKRKAISVYPSIKKLRGRLHIGTCSWNYPEWQEVGIYSQKQQRHYDYLPEYAEHFNSAEVDQWFWSLDSPESVRLPRSEDVEAYTQLTPDDFRFSVKAPNAITLTHFYKQAPKEFAGKPNPHFLSKKVMTSFVRALSPLKSKIGVVMFEFEYLNKEKMPSLPAFCDLLGPFLEDIPDDYSYAIEIRNPNYLKSDYFRFLKSHNVGHVFVDGYYMPSAYSVFEKFGAASPPTETVVIRLLGADRQGIEKKTRKHWTEIVDPRDKTITEISELLRKLIPQKFDVYANFNNHLEGCAPLSIEKFIAALAVK